MFRKNKGHLQPLLISNVKDLPEKHRKRLEKSWADVFYREIFCRLNEQPFRVLYADIPSRPNVPVNVLLGFECLKAGFGWSDEELYDAFIYNMQVRYALGYHQLGEGDFELRTLYNFRQRVSRYMQESGINLIEKAFEQVTDEQIRSYRLKTGKQRMDSTMIASNIRKMSRMQLLVEVLQRVHRMLSAEDQDRYAEDFAPYIQGHAGQFIYNLKGQDTQEHLQKIGELMHGLLDKLSTNYAENAIYQALARVFGEHFLVEGHTIHSKHGEQLSASSLQSPDDLEATYREKAGKSQQGYVVNITETCDPDNPLQLITKVQVAPNSTDDSQLLVEALPDLKRRTDLETLYTDGGHASPGSDQMMNAQQVKHVQTAIRGRKPHANKLHLSDFEIKQTETGKPVQITCPQGQHVPVRMGSKRKGFVAHFDPAICMACPYDQAGQCPVRAGKRDPRMRLYFSQAQAQVAQRRRLATAYQQEGRNLRAAVEATMREVKHPFPAGKLPVRGRIRVSCMVIASAAMTNVRRIHRYWAATEREKDKGKKTGKGYSLRQRADLFFSFGLARSIGWTNNLCLRLLCFGC